jgi:hypothetical protein
MLHAQQIDTRDRREVRRFVDLPFRLYAGHPQWVPPIRGDIRTMLDRDKHPFYEHSDADFFVVERDGEVVGRIAVLENRNYNRYHRRNHANFYLFDTVDDLDVVEALLSRVQDWAKRRGLTTLVGPKGFGLLDGYGILVEGFEHRQIMTMMNYNYPYYPRLLERLGFEKEVDFASCYIDIETFDLPERIHRISKRVMERSSLEIKRFKSTREIRSWTQRIRETYNRAFVDNWEFAPITEREADFLMDNAISLSDHRLIKIIVREEEMVGFLFGFPDVSAALQRAGGRLTPWALLDLLFERRRTTWLALNGGGLVPEFHGVGGNALLYSEMEKSIREQNFEHADLTQVAETAVQMRRDLENVGGKLYKNHRVYRWAI